MRPSRPVLSLRLAGSLAFAAACKSATAPEPPEALYQLTAAASPTNGGAVAPSSPSLPFDLDVTAIVRNRASGSWVNHGLQVDSPGHVHPGSTSLQKTRFQSLEVNADPSRRPRLIVEFQ